MKRLITIICLLAILAGGGVFYLRGHTIQSSLESLINPPNKNHVKVALAAVHAVKPIVIRYPSVPNVKEIPDIPERIDGIDRFQVAANISNKWVHTETAILANYVAFADALTATPLAYKLNAPILLTNPHSLTEETKKQLQLLGVKNIVIVGGEASISSTIVSELNSLGISNITRIAGKDRFEVSKNIAMKLGVNGTAVFVNGSSFADALAIAPYAASNSFPIVLTNRNQLPSDIDAFIKTTAINKSIVVGGDGSIERSIFNQLPNPTRVGGNDRYEVAANVANTFGQNRSRDFLATGLTFADALTGSVLAAKENGVILLTKSEQIPASTMDTVKQKDVPVTILGGVGSVKDDIVFSLIKMKPSKRPVLYIVPHQDDEILSYGVDIRNELSHGRNVQLVLLTRGDDSKSRDIINGKVYCSIHHKFHNPLKEGYKDGELSPDEFANARTDEYFRASKALGVPEGNIHAEFISDGHYYSTAIKAIIEKYLAEYPDADVRSFSWFDQHPAHALIGKTILNMQSTGEIERYQAKFLVSINTDRFWKVQKPMKVMMNRLENPNDLLFLKNAISQYTRFDPKNGYYAVGYHSVRVQFDALSRNPYVNSHY